MTHGPNVGILSPCDNAWSLTTILITPCRWFRPTRPTPMSTRLGPLWENLKLHPVTTATFLWMAGRVSCSKGAATRREKCLFASTVLGTMSGSQLRAPPSEGVLRCFESIWGKLESRNSDSGLCVSARSIGFLCLASFTPNSDPLSLFRGRIRPRFLTIATLV